MSAMLACVSEQAVVHLGGLRTHSIFGLDIPSNNKKINKQWLRQERVLCSGVRQWFKNSTRNLESFSALPSLPREFQPRGHRLAALLPDYICVPCRKMNGPKAFCLGTSAFYSGRELG